MAGYRQRMPSTDELLAVARAIHSKVYSLGFRCVLTGGLAMQLYGSPRLTKDVDVLANEIVDLRPQWWTVGKITVGGEALIGKDGIPVDWIVRDDDYQALYRDAVASAEDSAEGILIVTPEHLSAMKFAAMRPKDYDDLMYLLGKPGLVDPDKATNLVHRFVGGRFGVDQFKAAIEEARWREEKG
jgi:hypothetical protein